MPTKDIHQLNITTTSLIKFFALLLIFLLIYLLSDIFVALFFAIIVASAIEPAILWMEKKIPRILAVILIYLLGAFFFATFVYLVVPQLFEEVKSLNYTYAVLKEQIILGLERVSTLPFLSFFAQGLEGLIQGSSEYLEKVQGGLVEFVSIVFGGLYTFILIIIFSFYLAAQKGGITDFLRLVTPLRYEEYGLDLWGRSQKKLGRWLRTQLLLGAIVGILIFFGLMMLGMENAFIFATIAAVFEIIPVVGPVLAAVPAVLTALLISPLYGVAVAGLYFLVQQLESNVVIPVVMRRAVGLSPLVVLIALAVGAKLGGILGILLAVPVTVIAAEFINDWDKKKRELIPE